MGVSGEDFLEEETPTLGAKAEEAGGEEEEGVCVCVCYLFSLMH